MTEEFGPAGCRIRYTLHSTSFGKTCFRRAARRILGTSDGKERRRIAEIRPDCEPQASQPVNGWGRSANNHEWNSAIRRAKHGRTSYAVERVISDSALS